MNTPEKRFVNWADIDAMIDRVIASYTHDNWIPDVVVGVIRGGAIPAMWISNRTGIKADTIKASFRDDVIKHPHLPVTFLKRCAHSGDRVLIVEDINDTGETLIWIQNQIRAYQPDADRNVRYAALMDNTPSKFTDLNYHAETINKDSNPAWIVFPWEK